MRCSDGKRPSRMLLARRDVARQQMGSEDVNGNEGESVASRADGKRGSGPASERNSQWICWTVSEWRVGIEVRPASTGALSCTIENDSRTSIWGENT